MLLSSAVGASSRWAEDELRRSGGFVSFVASRLWIGFGIDMDDIVGASGFLIRISSSTVLVARVLFVSVALRSKETVASLSTKLRSRPSVRDHFLLFCSIFLSAVFFGFVCDLFAIRSFGQFRIRYVGSELLTLPLLTLFGNAFAR